MATRSTKHTQPPPQRQHRALVARVLIAVAVAALAFALLRVQVFSWEDYARIARENRLRAITIPAPRGTIYDRNGRVIAENVVAYQVLMMPAPEDSMIATLERLRPVLGLSDRDTTLALRRWRRARHLPMEVHRDIPAFMVPRLEEQRFQFPGVLVYEYPKRHYPAGAAAGHLVGYVAEISREELELPQFEGYRQGRQIGKAGLERQYESYVGGTPGVRYLEVDAQGRIKRWLPEEMGVPPVPGKDLQLNLDLDLQRYVMEIFPQGMKGAFVALDPRTGGVLAAYSAPGFDPNLLVGGADPQIWERLTSDPDKPLLDRSINGVHPPGSTFKLATAIIGLSTGAITPNSYMPVACSGGLRYQNRFARCWSRHGALNLVGAIKNSCNVYFYQVGIRLGLERFMQEGTRFGFNKPTGIDLPGEQTSIFPADKSFWQQRFGYLPYDNEVMGLTIGQNLVTLTPVKLAQMAAGLARDDSKVPVPRLFKSDAPPEFLTEYHLEPAQLKAIRRGMRMVHGPGGTAWLSRIPVWDYMGKTGTATNPHGKDHGVYIGIGGPPGEPYEIVAAMILEHGERGAITSGYAANAINFYLNRQHGLPFERYPSARDRNAHNLPIDWAWLQSDASEPPRPLQQVLDSIQNGPSRTRR
jgi:penicillin-binding protein 2